MCKLVNGRGRSQVLGAMVLALGVVIWQSGNKPVHAQLAADEAVFTDTFSLTCGVVKSDLSIVSTFACDSGAEAVDVTSDGTRAVIGSCFTDTLELFDLTTAPPSSVLSIPSGVSCVQELDIAPDDSFGISPGSNDGAVSKFTLAPFAVTGTIPGYFVQPGRNGSPQDVHIDVTSTEAVHPMFDTTLLQVADTTGAAPLGVATIPTTRTHHGISLSEADNDTILATAVGAPGSVTVASLIGLTETALIPTIGITEAVDITCDGTRAVVETSAGLVWLDMTTSPPTVLNDPFGPARSDGFSTSTVAFTSDGSILFVGGGSLIDVYDASTDPPGILGSINQNNVNVATLPCEGVIEIEIDVKAFSDPNGFNCNKRGVLPVTIWGTATFDVSDIDLTTVQLKLTDDTDVGGPVVNSLICDRGDPSLDQGSSGGALVADCFDAATGLPGTDGVLDKEGGTLDGEDDIDVRFDAQTVIGNICPAGTMKRDIIPPGGLVIMGELNDGTMFTSVPVPDDGIDQLRVQNAPR